MKEILRAVSSTEPCTFSEFLHGLPDVPERGDKEAWAELFDKLEMFENLGLVEIERNGGRIESLVLTEAGTAKVKGL
jgi:hypothetical protein